MTPADLHDIVVNGLFLLLLLMAPIVGAVAVAGIVGGLLARFARMQDPAITVVLRLVSVSAALVVAFPWISSRLVSFTRELWQLLSLSS